MKDFIREIERVQMLNKLIASRRTGNPDELAKILGVSRRQLYLIIDYMRDMGLRILFSRRLNSFYYDKDTGLSIIFRIEVLSTEEERKIAGGNKFNQHSAHPITGKENPVNYFVQ